MKPLRSNTCSSAAQAGALKGHGFSRAACMTKSMWALAPEECFSRNLQKVRLSSAAAAALLALAASLSQAQTPNPTTSAQNAQRTAAEASDAKQPRNSDRRRAARLYLAASKLFMDQHFEEAMQDYEQAAKLDPTNANYRLAAEVARSHAVTALIQSAAKARLRGDAAGARAALAHALELDPKSIEATQHLYELGDDAIRGQSKPFYEQAAGTAGEAVSLAPAAGLHSFHLSNDQRQTIQQVFKAYGIIATTDDSVQPTRVRMDIDDASFDEATRVLCHGYRHFLRSARCAPRSGGARHPGKSPAVHSSGDGDRLSFRPERG